MNGMDKRICGRRVRELRRLRGYSVDTLSKVTGANEKTIKLFESGVTIPGVEICYNIMSALESNISYLLTGKNDICIDGDLSKDIFAGLKRLDLRDLEVVLKLVTFLTQEFNPALFGKLYYEYKLEKIIKEQNGGGKKKRSID